MAAVCSQNPVSAPSIQSCEKRCALCEPLGLGPLSQGRERTAPHRSVHSRRKPSGTHRARLCPHAACCEWGRRRARVQRSSCEPARATPPPCRLPRSRLVLRPHRPARQDAQGRGRACRRLCRRGQPVHTWSSEQSGTCQPSAGTQVAVTAAGGRGGRTGAAPGGDGRSLCPPRRLTEVQLGPQSATKTRRCLKCSQV